MEWNIQPTANTSAFNVQELSWDQARIEVQRVAPALFQIIESLSPGKELTLVKARYPFGALIIDQGKLQMPHQSGKTVSLDQAEIDPTIKKKLSYTAIPLSLPLNKSCEVFVEADQKTMPLKIISPGWFFGLFETAGLLAGFHLNSIWSVSSGARSLFMLPKIADRLGYNRIKKELNLALNPPQTIFDHWELFRLISQHPMNLNEWYTDVLFFTESWFKHDILDAQRAIFYNYLFKENNIQLHYQRDDFAMNITWKNFVKAIGDRSFRPKPYMLDTVKHLISIAAGMMPGFCPADDSETLAPTQILQHVYTHIYELKNYLPTLMHAHILMPGQKIRPVYYSLAYPVFQENSHNKYPDVIANQREIKLLFETLESALATGRVKLPPEGNLLQNRKYEFFHNNPDFFAEIPSAEKMLLDDPSFESDNRYFTDRIFCTTSPFLSGCIRISIKT